MADTATGTPAVTPAPAATLRPWNFQPGNRASVGHRGSRPPEPFRKFLSGERTENIILSLYRLAIDPKSKHAVRAAELLLAYRYGRPKEYVQVDGDGMKRSTAELVAVVIKAALMDPAARAMLDEQMRSAVAPALPSPTVGLTGGLIGDDE